MKTFGWRMKTQVWLISTVIGLTFVVSCKKKEDKPEPTPPPASEVEVLEGELRTEKTLDPAKKYLLKGQYIVREGGVLRIPEERLSSEIELQKEPSSLTGAVKSSQKEPPKSLSSSLLSLDLRSETGATGAA